MYTKVSDKGQVVVPKSLRDAKGWCAGTDLEAVDVGDGVLLRRRAQKKGLSVEEAVARFKQLYQHVGPPVTLAQMKEDAAEAAAARFGR